MLPAFLSSTVSQSPHQAAAAPRTMATPRYVVAMSPELSDGCPFESGAVPGAAALALWSLGVSFGFGGWLLVSGRGETAIDPSALPRILGQLVGAQSLEARHHRQVDDDADVEQEEERGPHVLFCFCVFVSDGRGGLISVLVNAWDGRTGG